jgi:RIO kinase 2
LINIEAAKREYDFLVKLKSTKMNIATPYFRSMHSIVMNRINGLPLIEIRNLENPREIFYKVFKQIKIAYKENIINGDVSEYNILLDENNDTFIIDWPQAVTLEHPNAEYLIRRDIHNVIRYFTRKYDLNIDENSCYDSLLK